MYSHWIYFKSSDIVINLIVYIGSLNLFKYYFLEIV